MQRRTVLKSFSGIAVGSVLAGCGSSGETGTLSTRVSDQPGDIGDFDSLLIQINGIRVKPEDEDLRQLDADAEVDLTDLVGEASALVDESELETGSYEFLQLEAEATEATLSGGGTAEVMLPGDAPLKFNQAFEIRTNQQTSFTADFTPVKQGQTDRYVLQPVADAVEVIYGTVTGS
jgi:hypothetical protein